MKDTLESLRHKIEGAGDLKSVIRTMKALSASSITQYERAVQSLDDYFRTIELGLFVCFRQVKEWPVLGKKEGGAPGAVGAIVFGASQGLAGQFNDVVAAFATSRLAALPGKKIVWAAGDSLHGRLEDAGFPPVGLFTLPTSVDTITPLVGQMLREIETRLEAGELTRIFLLYNRPQTGAIYTPVCQTFLPLDDRWREELCAQKWQSNNMPDVMGSLEVTLTALVREYLFVSLFRACAESLASEHASRLAAMQRADKNIEDLLNDLNLSYHRLRQSAIDEELFDVIAGSEALGGRHG